MTFCGLVCMSCVSDPYILQGCCCFFLQTCNMKSKDSMEILIIYRLSIALQRLYLPYFIVFILAKSLNNCENFVVYTNHYSLKGSHSENILVGVFLSYFKSHSHTSTKKRSTAKSAIPQTCVLETESTWHRSS